MPVRSRPPRPTVRPRSRRRLRLPVAAGGEHSDSRRGRAGGGRGDGHQFVLSCDEQVRCELACGPSYVAAVAVTRLCATRAMHIFKLLRIVLTEPHGRRGVRQVRRLNPSLTERSPIQASLSPNHTRPTGSSWVSWSRRSCLRSSSSRPSPAQTRRSGRDRLAELLAYLFDHAAFAECCLSARGWGSEP